MNQIHIAPNKPLYVALVDPNGEYDFELRVGRYITTCGQLLTLPRPAVEMLNRIEPKPGEELQIVKSWSGKSGESMTWTVALSNHSEMARAEAQEPDSLTATLQASIEAAERRKANQEPPTPIRAPEKAKPAASQPRLFDQRGTGTYGPAAIPAPAAPVPAVARQRFSKPEPIPANIAVKEILAFVNADPNTANWSADSRQDLATTVLIAAYKAGHVGLWERNQ